MQWDEYYTKVGSAKAPASNFTYNCEQNSVESDAMYFMDKYYPDKMQAVEELVCRGVPRHEAIKAVDVAILEIDNAAQVEKSGRQEKAQKVFGGIGKGLFIGLMGAVAASLRLICNITKPYMKGRK